jgi:hypothetical protein
MENYTTKDFYLTAVCMATGCTLLRLERNPNDLVDFVLKESPETCISIITEHWAGTLHVSSKKIIEAINELKTRIHSKV